MTGCTCFSESIHGFSIICDVIKKNESEFQSIVFKMYPNITDNFFVSYCFYNPLNACIFGTNRPITVGSVIKGSFANDVYNQSEKGKLNLTNFKLNLLACIIYEPKCHILPNEHSCHSLCQILKLTLASSHF